MTNFKLKIEEITFDIEDDSYELTLDEELKLQKILRNAFTGKVYDIEADCEDDAHCELMEMVTEDSGWCIYSMESVTL